MNQVWEGNPGWRPHNQRWWPCSQSRGQAPSQVDRNRTGTVQIKGNTRISFKVWLKWKNLWHYLLIKCLISLYFRIFKYSLILFRILYYYILNYIIYLVNYVGYFKCYSFLLSLVYIFWISSFCIFSRVFCICLLYSFNSFFRPY